MSRSTVVKQELSNGNNLVCIIGAVKEGSQVLITFADGKNNQHEELYDFNRSKFIKMCHAAGTISDKEVFNSKDCIGKSLWITYKSGEILETLPYVEGTDKPIVNELPPEKKKIIAEAREMIKAVESGNSVKQDDEDSI